MNGLHKLTSKYLTLPTVALMSAGLMLLAVVSAVIVFFATLYTGDLAERDVCFASKCVEFWIKENSAVFGVLSGAGTVVTGLVTIGGILIALKSYQSSVRASAITNHLSHLTLFIAYVSSEIKRRSRIADAEVEALKWYNLIYDESMLGKLSVSGQYASFIDKLNSQIESSNCLYASAEGDGYRYKDHQEKMILILCDVGIYLERLPRIDFNEVETQILDLLETINMSFCRAGVISKVSKRNYH